MSLRLAVTFPLSLGVPGGGTEDCLNLSRHLQRQGARVVLFSALSSGPGRYPRRPPAPEAFEAVRAELEGEGLGVVPVPAHGAHYLLDGRPMRRAVERHCDRQPIDALIGWWHEAAFLPGPLRRRGIVFAVNAAASYALSFPASGRWRRPLQTLRARLLVRRPLREAAVVFARSAFTARELTAFAGVAAERIRIVPCGIDPRFGAVERRSVDGPPRVLYFGRLQRAKGIFDALDALGRLAAAGASGWRLRVAGWGDAERVRAAARAAGVLEQLDLLGPLDRPALLQELARAELALLPSFSESFGLANAEALAAGVPVVAYGAGAVPEVVEDGRTGWLVPTGDVEGLARALGQALGDAALRRERGRAGRARVLERFTWERSARATLDGLEAALGARGNRSEAL